MQIDAQLNILWDFEFFEKCPDSFNFRKIWAIVPKMHTNMQVIHRSSTFVIEFYQNRLKRSNFLIFWKFSLNCVTCENFELLRGDSCENFSENRFFKRFHTWNIFFSVFPEACRASLIRRPTLWTHLLGSYPRNSTQNFKRVFSKRHAP